MDQLSLGGGGGGVLIEKLLDMVLVGRGVLSGQDGGAGSEAMAQRVERRTLLAGCGARTGGVQGVGAVDGGALVRPRLCGLASVGRDPLWLGLRSLGCCCHLYTLARDNTAGDAADRGADIVCCRGSRRSGGKFVIAGAPSK